MCSCCTSASPTTPTRHVHLPLSNDALARKAEQHIEGSLDGDAVLQRVEPFGYPAARFEEGRALLAAFQELRDGVTAEGRQKDFTVQVQAAWDQIHRRVYMPALLVARRTYQGAEERERLGLDRTRTFDTWSRPTASSAPSSRMRRSAPRSLHAASPTSASRAPTTT